MKLIISFFLSAVALVQCATTKHSSDSRLVHRQDGSDFTAYESNSRVIPWVCPGSFACSMVDPAWPTKGFSCPQNTASDSVSDYSFITAQETAMMYGGGDAIEFGEWPKECHLPPPGAVMMKYSNGQWDAIYSVTPICHCPLGVQPRCTRATGLSKLACNMAVLKFCQMRIGSDVCTPN